MNFAVLVSLILVLGVFSVESFAANKNKKSNAPRKVKTQTPAEKVYSAVMADFLANGLNIDLQRLEEGACGSTEPYYKVTIRAKANETEQKDLKTYFAPIKGLVKGGAPTLIKNEECLARVAATVGQ